MPKPVVVVHGGDSFPSHEEYLDFIQHRPVTADNFRAKNDWKVFLSDTLGPDFDVFQPRMPNNYDARFEEWVIWFERLLPFLHDDTILIGHSLGGLFLAKFLALHRFPYRIERLCLVAAPFTQRRDTHSFNLPDSLQGIADQCDAIDLFHSEDDPVVPVSDVDGYADALPAARVHRFTGRKHCNTSEFSELIATIKNGSDR